MEKKLKAIERALLNILEAPWEPQTKSEINQGMNLDKDSLEALTKAGGNVVNIVQNASINTTTIRVNLSKAIQAMSDLREYYVKEVGNGGLDQFLQMQEAKGKSFDEIVEMVEDRLLEKNGKQTGSSRANELGLKRTTYVEKVRRKEERIAKDDNDIVIDKE